MKKATIVFFSLALLAACGKALAEEGRNGHNEDNQGGREEGEGRQERGVWVQSGEADHSKQTTDSRQEHDQWRIERQAGLEKSKSEKESLRLQFKEQLTAERCARIESRIQERTGNFDKVEAAHLKVYDNLVARINKFADRFEAAGLDTATLKSHLAELQTKIDKFKEDFAAYRTQLSGSQKFTCGHSEGDFRATLLDAKGLLQTVHADAADIRTYVRETIFSDLKALKSQMPKGGEELNDGGAGSDTDADENESGDDQGVGSDTEQD